MPTIPSCHAYGPYLRAIPSIHTTLNRFKVTVENQDSLARDRIVSGKREEAAAQTEAEYIELIRKLPTSKEKRVVSYGLYGTNPKYTTGAIRNAELVKIYFPGWVARFYVDNSVPGSHANTYHPPNTHHPLSTTTHYHSSTTHHSPLTIRHSHRPPLIICCHLPTCHPPPVTRHPIVQVISSLTALGAEIKPSNAIGGQIGGMF